MLPSLLIRAMESLGCWGCVGLAAVEVGSGNFSSEGSISYFLPEGCVTSFNNVARRQGPFLNLVRFCRASISKYVDKAHLVGWQRLKLSAGLQLALHFVLRSLTRHSHCDVSTFFLNPIFYIRNSVSSISLLSPPSPCLSGSPLAISLVARTLHTNSTQHCPRRKAHRETINNSLQSSTLFTKSFSKWNNSGFQTS